MFEINEGELTSQTVPLRMPIIYFLKRVLSITAFILLVLSYGPMMGQNHNTFTGSLAGFNNTTGDDNTFTGSQAGFDNTLGSRNSFFGSYAGRNSTGFNNSFFGHYAGLSNSSGYDNSFFGKEAGRRNTTGRENNYFGTFAGAGFNTGGGGAGIRNSFFGDHAGFKIYNGEENSFFGKSAGFNNDNGSNNNFFGNSAGFKNTTGIGNNFFGSSAGFSNKGSYNSFFGRNAGSHNTVGHGNVCIGSGAGPSVANSNLNLRLYIDASTTSTDGNDAPLIYGEFDNDFVRINGTFEVTGGLTNPSSRKLKNQFVAMDASTILAKLSTLDIQQWAYKHRPDEKHVGPIAEDFYALFGLGAGDTNISTIDSDGIMMLAIQALKNENEALKSTLEKQDKKLIKQEELIREIIRKLE